MRAREGLALRTVDLARAVGVHPNTVRLYVERGYLPPVLRSPTGYRLFESRHLDHLRVARLLLRDRWPGRAIRRSAKVVLVEAAGRGLAASGPAFAAHLDLVRRELAMAERAREVTRRWLLRDDGPAEAWIPAAEASRRLHLTLDTLRSWERSGLVRPTRDPATGRRRYGPADLDRLAVIRTLRAAGYSPLAVLRMLAAADRGDPAQAVSVLVDPGGDEDLVTAGDRWVETLTEHERCAERAVELVAEIGQNGQPSASAPPG